MPPASGPDAVSPPTVVLFDLGGVLVDNGGITELRKWNPDLAGDALWERWLTSESVRAFESGRTDAAAFSRSMVEEFEVDLSADRFELAFTRWIRGFYEGAPELIEETGRQVRTGCLSNTNGLHWDRMNETVPLENELSDVFLSFRLGMLKPDRELFREVSRLLFERVGAEATEILFLDDHPTNVAAARASGWRAECVRGPVEARNALASHGVGVALG